MSTFENNKDNNSNNNNNNNNVNKSGRLIKLLRGVCVEMSYFRLCT